MAGDLTVAWLRTCAEVVSRERAWLTELDAAIGDGDHGINLDRGFAAVVATLPGPGAPASGADLLSTAGRTILGSVGGASGALYGRALLRAGSRLSAGGGQDRDAALVAAVLGDAIDGIIALGRAQPGDKTMLDALVPAHAVLLSSAESGAPLLDSLEACADAAWSGALTTVPLIARKGRASYLGERSVGHLDPGAASSSLILRSLADAAALVVQRE